MTQPEPPESANPRASAPASTERPVPRESARAHDREFASFYREYMPRLVTYLTYQGAPAHLAAELAQETMIAIYRRWEEIEYPKAYAYKIANKAYIRHATQVTDLPVDEVPEPTGVLPNPEAAEAWLQQQQIIQVLRTLPPRQRQVLALTLDDWSPTEIADLLTIDPSAVRSNLLKARRNAAYHLRHLGEEDP